MWRDDRIGSAAGGTDSRANRFADGEEEAESGQGLPGDEALRV